MVTRLLCHHSGVGSFLRGQFLYHCFTFFPFETKKNCLLSNHQLRMTLVNILKKASVLNKSVNLDSTTVNYGVDQLLQSSRFMGAPVDERKRSRACVVLTFILTYSVTICVASNY